MIEKPALVELGARRLFRVLYLPDGNARAGVLLAPPFFDEARAAGRFPVLLARELAARGFACARFDYASTGESGGAAADLTLTGAREDLRRVAADLLARAGTDRLALVGLRMGASLAFLEASRANAAALALLAPIRSGERYLRLELERRRLRRAMTAGSAGAGAADEVIDLDGIAVSPRLAGEIRALDLAAAEAPACPALLVDLGPRREPSRELAALAARMGDAARAEAIRIPSFWTPLEHVETEGVRARAAAFLEEAFP